MEIEGIKNIIKEPVHGSEFYTKETLKELVNKLAQIFGQLEITDQTDPENAIAIVQNYIKYNVNLRSSYFDAFCERSWGMSHDYRIAVKHGSNMVRVGTTIFGPRIY